MGKPKLLLACVSVGMRLLVCVLICTPLMTATAHAQTAQSTHYGVDEVFFGTGGELNACSTAYCSKQAAGELTVGNTASTSYQAQAGFNTTSAPYLQFIVNASSVNLGTLTSGTTYTTTGSFSVKAYLASGYVVQTASFPPVSGSHYLTPLASPTASNNNAEQFGINLVANTSPTSFGAPPAQLPDTTFGFGQVAAGYNTPNFYKYNKGDTVAYSTTSSGETDFTLSYIFNVSPVTPGGVYSFNHILVATATY
jgi:hypothetical protein